MTTLTKTQDRILRAAAEAGADGILTEAKDAKTVAALTAKSLVTSALIPEGGATVYISEAGAAVFGETAQAAEPPPATPESAAPKGKIALLVSLLGRAEGTTIEAMMAATGWQAHSVRGAMSGSVKKALGLAIASEKADGVRIYRIVEAAAA